MSTPVMGTGSSPTTWPSERHRPTRAPRRRISGPGAGALSGCWQGSLDSGIVPPISAGGSVLVKVDQVAAGIVQHRVHAAIGHPVRLLDKHHPPGPEPLGLPLAVIGAYRQHRPGARAESLLEPPRRRISQVQHQLHPIGLFCRDQAQPALVGAIGGAGLDLKAEDVAVEPLGLVLILDIDTDQSNLHRSCPFSFVVRFIEPSVVVLRPRYPGDRGGQASWWAWDAAWCGGIPATSIIWLCRLPCPGRGPCPPRNRGVPGCRGCGPGGTAA